VLAALVCTSFDAYPLAPVRVSMNIC